MGRGRFSPQEMSELRVNPYVVFVDERQVFFSEQFKEHFMEQYEAGVKPTAIFRQANIDPKILGAKRIERAAARWKAAYYADTLGQKHAAPPGQNRENKDILAYYSQVIEEKNQQILALETQIADLSQK